MIFVNRAHAGRQLAEKIEQFTHSRRGSYDLADLVVIGLARGGVPVALEVARKFQCPLGVLVSKKIPFPAQPEYAIGAVSSDGVVVLNPDIPQEPEWKAYIDAQRLRLLHSTRTKETQFYALAGCKPISFKDKIVVLVDDGIATGMTAMAAVETARQRGAKRTVLAAPVMSAESFHDLGSHCDDVVAISVPHDFLSVGQFYDNFTQTSDEEVVSALRQSLKFAVHPDSLTAQPKVKPAGTRGSLLRNGG